LNVKNLCSKWRLTTSIGATAREYKDYPRELRSKKCRKKSHYLTGGMGAG